MAGDTGGEGERAPIVDELATNQQQVDLAHEFIVQTQGKVRFVHFVQGGEGDVTGGADQGIETAGLLEQAANRGAVTDINLVVTAAAADAQHLVALLQFFGNGRADGAASADQEDFH
ncbi:hypothetical protein D3C77_452790 [compost metagenome]